MKWNTSSLGEATALARPITVQRRARLQTALALVLPLLGLSSFPARAESSDYVLGPQDKVRVRVYEWRATRDEIFEWKPLKEDFTVGAAGMVSIPFAGEIRAAGMSTQQLANEIAARLETNMGLGRRPDTAVEVVQFRPFYVVGQVDHPGEFPYRPGLTVLQAVSIAGGLRRVGEQGMMRLGREAISTRGELGILGKQGLSLLVRKARLEAELARADTITFPNELKDRQNDPSVALAMQQEEQIFNARRDALQTELRALEQLRTYLAQEVTSLDAQLGTENIQYDLVKKELQSVSSLVDKGYAVAPRQLGLERTLAQIEGDRLRVGSSVIRAKQEISRTEINILELQNKRTTEITSELRDTQAKYEEVRRKFDTTEQLLYETEVLAPQAVLRQAREQRAQPVYTIVRQRGGEATELAASEGMAVEPGDTVKVDLPLPTDGGPFADVLPSWAAESKSNTEIR